MKKKLILLFLTITLTQIVCSQPGPPPGVPCWPPPCIPIDGGITIFSIIAAAFGYRHLSKNK